MMDAYITTPKMSEILWEEFMEPMGISAYKLAKAIHVPTSRIQDILHDRRKITARSDGQLKLRPTNSEAAPRAVKLSLRSHRKAFIYGLSGGSIICCPIIDLKSDN